MTDWLNLILATLACYRLSQLIALDEGPAIKKSEYGLLHQLRLKLGAYDYGSNGEAQTNIGRGITCVHCVGIWMAGPLAVFASGIHWYTLIYWIAIAGGSSFLWSLKNDDQ